MFVSFSVSLAKSGVDVFVFTRFPSSWFKTFLLLFVFAFLISNDSLIFRLWYCCSVDKVSGFIQLNYTWHCRQCSVAPELSHFPLKLSCWCSMVLVMTFLVSPIPKYYESLLNLWPKFVPMDKNLPFMDITSTESCALHIKHNHTENEAETLRPSVSNILQKNLNLKIRSNLKRKWKKSIKRITKKR